jgi:PAS domain S-box-containing protein
MTEIEKNIERYEKLVSDSYNEIYTFDTVSYKFIYLNKSALNNLGYTMEEMIELTPIDIKPNLDITSFEKLILPLRNKKKTKIQFYTTHQRKDGTLYPTEVHLQLNSKGKNQYFSAFIIDITERKLAENALKMSEAKFKDLFEKSDDALLIIKNNIFVDCNIATSKMLGYTSKNEFINVHPSKLSPKIQPDGKESFEKSEEMMSIAFKKGSHRFEWMHTKKSGEDFPVEVLLTTIHNEQNNKVIYCVWRDITERKFQELKLRENKKSLLEAQRLAKIGSYNLNLKTNIIESSAVYNEIVGIDSNCELTFPLWRTITHPEDTPTNQKVLEKCLKTGEKFDLEYRILTKNAQKLKWIHGLGEVIYEKGKPTNFFGTIQDITEKKITEKKLKISEDRFSKSFYNNATPMLILNLETGDRIDINESYSKLIGYTKNEIFKRNLYKSNLAYDQNKLKELINKAKKSAEPIYEEYLQIIKKTGEIISTLVNVSKLGDFSDDLIICSFTDITEREKIINQLKESEARFKALHNASLGGISIHDKGVVLECNQGLCDMMGYPINEIIGMNGILLIAEQSRDFVMDKILSGTEKPYEAFGLRKNGEKFPMRLEARNVPYKGKMVRTVEFRDITESKKIEEELANYRKQLEVENVFLKEQIALSFNYEDMVYSSLEFGDVLTQVEQVASTDATVLVLGETGTGKELIAKAIHNTSDRKDKSLIRVNCAAIPTELIESELFGHIKGSFTGAINNRIGKFELANKGTLFLDEIGEMPLALQPKLLRAIQEGEIEPIGSSKIRKLNVRIIAATNKDLKKEAEEKRFREDLYFRLNVFPITIPPLRKRIEDIPILIDHFVNKYCKKHNKDIKYISDHTLQQMKSYEWPGNVRELENLIERAVIISNEDYLIINEFNNNQTKKTIIKHTTTTLEEVQRNHIFKILNETQWKIEGKKGAAVKLNIKPSTLRDRMKKLGIIRPNI